jgi:hypothetical protein
VSSFKGINAVSVSRIKAIQNGSSDSVSDDSHLQLNCSDLLVRRAEQHDIQCKWPGVSISQLKSHKAEESVRFILASLYQGLRSPDFQEKVVHMQHALKYLNFVESVWES